MIIGAYAGTCTLRNMFHMGCGIMLKRDFGGSNDLAGVELVSFSVAMGRISSEKNKSHQR
jgi:hypothetical protein